MDSNRITLFDDKKVIITKMSLSDANKVMLPVINSVSRLLLGETDLFSNWVPANFVSLQECMCKYITFLDTSKNINLFDISENLGDFIGLQYEFLEFNFKLFSQSQKIMKRINGQLLETNATDAQSS